jgi:hypothetical protein
MTLGKFHDGAGCWWSASSRMLIIARSAGGLDLFEDVGSLRGPDEGFGTLIMFVDEFSDGHDEFFSVMKDAAPQTILCEVAE